MSRRSAREKAMQLLYQLESQKGHALEQIDLFLEERAPLPGSPRLVEPEEEGQGSAVEVLDEDDRAYIKALALGVMAKANELDRLYGPYLNKWTPERLPIIERVLLRIGTYEICYAEDVPNSVAISEIIRLCKDYADEDSYAYINAVLAKVEREVAKEDTEESGASQ